MGKRNTGSKGKVKQGRQHHIQKSGVAQLHIGLDLNEAVSYEQDILNSKIALIKASQSLKNYKTLRKADFEKKSELRHLLRSLDVAMKIVKENLPKVEEAEDEEEKKEEYEPSVLPETQEVEEIPAEEKKPAAKPSSLELELLDIKKKLERLQGE